MTSPRYVKHFSLAMVAYSLVLVGSIFAIQKGELSGWSAGLASLTPLIPALYALKVFIARFKSMDEFQQSLISEALLWATGIVSFAAFGYGFLEGAVDVPAVGLLWVMPSICGVFGIVHWILHWQANR
ncbi:MULTISPECIES: hypothetical protein [Maricaulis]|jgi:hypothetical protein|uniref:hypothetical protein n=1 Tax=Maricaulis TaxID=74317 RepID=UPI000C45CC31|nr:MULTISPECIES: hypothetical protein [Maricaulis]MAC88333.1 hypothetical protein [Maricaulis sp.]